MANHPTDSQEQPFPYRPTPHEKKNTTKSSAPEDGHKVARNRLSKL